MDRRTFLTSAAGMVLVPSIPLQGMGRVNIKPKPSEVFSEILPKIEAIRKVSINGEMQFFDDPCLMKRRCWGIYGWGDELVYLPPQNKIQMSNLCMEIPNPSPPTVIRHMSTYWRMEEFQQRPHDLLQEIGNHFGSYEVISRVEKTFGRLKAGDISGIKIMGD